MGRTGPFPLEDGFGQPLDLGARRGGHEQDQLVAANLLERADSLPRLLRRLDGARPAPGSVVAVVVLHVALRLARHLVAESEVAERPELGFARPAGPVPDRGDTFHHPAQLLRRPAAERKPDPVLADPCHRPPVVATTADRPG